MITRARREAVYHINRAYPKSPKTSACHSLQCEVQYHLVVLRLDSSRSTNNLGHVIFSSVHKRHHQTAASQWSTAQSALPLTNNTLDVAHRHHIHAIVTILDHICPRSPKSNGIILPAKPFQLTFNKRLTQPSCARDAGIPAACKI